MYAHSLIIPKGFSYMVISETSKSHRILYVLLHSVFAEITIGAKLNDLVRHIVEHPSLQIDLTNYME
jgi:hypothetical protein